MEKLSTLKYYYKSIYNASNYIYHSHGNMKMVPVLPVNEYQLIKDKTNYQGEWL
jgi:hypothetical protein